MSKRKLNALILDSAEANSYDVSSAEAYLKENNVKFQSFLERGMDELGITNKAAEKRALELYPVNFWRNLPEFDTGLNQREAYLKCWEDMQEVNTYTIEDIEKCVENWGICKVEEEYIKKFLNKKP